MVRTLMQSDPTEYGGKSDVDSKEELKIARSFWAWVDTETALAYRNRGN